MYWQAKQTGRFKSGMGSYVNPLTTNEYRIVVIEIWQHGGCAIEWVCYRMGLVSIGWPVLLPSCTNKRRKQSFHRVGAPFLAF